MTTDKSQPTGWVVVDFADDVATFRDSRNWQAKQWPMKPFASLDAAETCRADSRHRDRCEVHPWPLPASVLARLKERHPNVDWSQVPVAVEAEKPGRWVLEAGCSIDPYRDRDGWKQSANVCSSPWSTRAEVEEFMKSKGLNPSSVRPVNLDDLPAADAKTNETPGRWVIQDLTGGHDPYRDQDGWQQSAGACSQPWSTMADAAAFMRKMDWSLDRFALVNLGDLPAPAVAEPSEVEKLRAEVERLQEEVSRLTAENAAMHQAVEMAWRGGKPEGVTDHASGIYRLTLERDEHQSDADVLRKDLAAYADQLCAIWALLPDDIATQGGPAASAVRGFIDRLKRERDELREELSRCKQAHSAAEDDVESLREQLGKATLSRRDEFAKAALCGLLANSQYLMGVKETAGDAVAYADATIRALDGAGGA